MDTTEGTLVDFFDRMTETLGDIAGSKDRYV
jgi:hypothetical protein